LWDRPQLREASQLCPQLIKMWDRPQVREASQPCPNY